MNDRQIIERVRAAVAYRSTMFYTPEDRDAMDEWLSNMPPQIPTGVAAMVGFNYALRQVEKELNTQTWTVIWRIDGEFEYTDVTCDASSMPKDSAEWVAKAIEQQAEELTYAEGECKEDHIAHCFAEAFDPEHPGFMGYELIGVVEGGAEWFNT